MHLPVDLRSNTLEGNEKFLRVQQLTAGCQLLRNANLLELCMKQQVRKAFYLRYCLFYARLLHFFSLIYSFSIYFFQ